MTSYSNPLGAGQRRGMIAFDWTANFSSGLPTPGGLLDGSTGNANFFTSQAVAGLFIRFDFRDARVIDEAKWYQSNSASHGDWKWQGSNDGSSWTDIGGTFTLGGATVQTQTTLNGNIAPYRFYQLLGVSGNKSTSPFLQEIEFKIDDGTGFATTFYHALGYGDRTGSITVTTTATMTQGNASNFVDGAFADNGTDSIAFTNGQTSREIVFDLGAAKLVTDACWTQSNTTAHGTWKWQVSNDGSSYVDIGGTFTLGNHGSRQTFFDAVFGSNTVAYRYFKLVQTGGSMSSSPWVHEVTFKVGDPMTPTPPGQSGIQVFCVFFD